MLRYSGYSLCFIGYSWTIHPIQMYQIPGTKSKTQFSVGECTNVNFFFFLGFGICRWAWKWSSEFRLICSPTSTCCTLNSSSRWVESRWILQVPSKSPSCNLRHTFVVGKKYFSKELFKSLVSILVPTLNPDFRLHWCGARNIVTPTDKIYLKYSKDFWTTSIFIWSLLMCWWRKSIHWALFHIASSWMH